MPPEPPMEPRQSAPLSRRKVLALPLLAAVAAPMTGPTTAAANPAGVVGRGGPAAADGDAAAYQAAFEKMVAGDPTVRRYLSPGREILYRPRQLLAADQDLDRVLGWLRRHGYDTTVQGRFAGVSKVHFGQEVDIPSIVWALRDPKQWPDGAVPVVQPHHVTVGFGNIMGNPDGPPLVAAALPEPDPDRLDEGAGVLVGICDTGIWSEAQKQHPVWLGGHYTPEVDDVDPLYTSGDLLALQGGHGTFVAGVVRQAAPGVSFDPEQALNASGLGDEESLVDALARLPKSVSIVNLSLGCYTLGDVPPVPLVNAINGLPQGTVVVAAAGNSGANRPSWPAALTNVVATTAIQWNDGSPAPAPYSNYGTWVDVCATGDWTSTYVNGRLLLPGLPERVFTGFAQWTGTSFSTAYVSGRLAAIMTTEGVDAATARSILLAQPRWHPDYGVLVP